MMIAVYFLFNFSVQITMVHLVNYATDIGIGSLVAATFISIIGIFSFTGRVIMGTMSDRIGSANALLICCFLIMGSMAFLNFASVPWMFYLFAVAFGFSYGGEVPQMPVLIGNFFGLRATTVLVGVVVFSAGMGGALGAWMAGRLFDVFGSYQSTFTIAVATSLVAIVVAWKLKKEKSPVTLRRG